MRILCTQKMHIIYNPTSFVSYARQKCLYYIYIYICHMDNFTDLLATFLDLDLVRNSVVYAGSQSL